MHKAPVIITLALSVLLMGADIKAKQILKIPTTEKILYLTFDDGPHPRVTPKVLKTLKRHSIKATFFLLGRNCERYPKIVKQIQEEGHDIQNHSYDHADFTLLSNEQIDTDIRQSQALLESLIDKRPEFVRVPYGRITPRVYKHLKKSFKEVIKWNIDTKDWDIENNSLGISTYIINHVGPGSILLFHDNNNNCLQTLASTIPALKDLGYIFHHLSAGLETPPN